MSTQFRQLLAALALAVCTACGGGARQLAPPVDVDDPAARADLMAPALDGYRAAYVLRWNGRRIGDARERFYAHASEVGSWRFERDERIEVRRGGVVSSARTHIVIDLDDALSARRLVVERWTGPQRTVGEATRLVDESWRIEYGSAPARLVDGEAVPSTLVPLLVAAGGARAGRAFEAPVLVEGAGLAVARLAIDVDTDRRVARARLETAAGTLRADARLDERGFLVAGGAEEALASRRATEEQLAEPFDPPEIVDSAAVAVTGVVPADDAPLRLAVDDLRATPPVLAEIAAQKVTAGDKGWRITVEPIEVRDGDRELREVTERTRHVARMLGDDLGLSSLDASEALAAGRGDCTAHAVVLQKLLLDRGYDARLVTGFILDDGALRRHRWVTVRVRGEWIPVDPMYDEVPASPAHVALAVHGSSLDELAFIDDVAFAGWTGVTARVVQPNQDR